MSEVAALGDDWACEHCTWNNTASDLTCSMCYQVRVSTKDAPVLWQWSTGHEWIPYDLDTTLALEHAYQQHQPELELAHGFFAANPGYSVTFGGGGVGSAQRGRARHVQTNNNSGMRRQVRRLAEDDAEMFRPVSEEERRQAEKCSICQLEFEEEEEAAEEQGSEVDGATDSEEDGGGIEAVTRAASRQAGSAKKSGSVSGNQPLHHSASNAAASVATVAVSATPATACAPSASASPSSADRIVRLAHCAPGHAFHLSCIASWIKLKDVCPYCHTAI